METRCLERGGDRGLGRGRLQAQLQALAIPLYCGPRWPLRLGGMVPAGLRAGQVVRQFRPGLLHLHTEIPESTYAALAALRPGVAPGGVVRTIHNSAYWDFWPQLGRWCERRLGPSRVAAVSTAALAAFHAPSDRVLILDVARYRYPSVWVPVADLWKAIRTTDTTSGRSRGLVTIRRLPGETPPPGTVPPPGPS